MDTEEPDKRLTLNRGFKFNFNCIIDTKEHKALCSLCTANDYCRDITIPGSIEPVNKEDYIHVVQRSDLWFSLRSKAHGTASSLGKYIFTGAAFQTEETVRDAWFDKLSKKKFEMKRLMEVHTLWGKIYEDTAGMYFSKFTGLGVCQVGTIYVSLEYVNNLFKIVYSSGKSSKRLTENKLAAAITLPNDSNDEHLLISPDGLVGKPENGQCDNVPISECQRRNYNELTGMIEIKCGSPFNNYVNADDEVTTVANYSKRMYNTPMDIPHTYIIQMGLQAIAGVKLLDFTAKHKMYFVRWLPNEIRIFTAPFYYYINVGICATIYYFLLHERMKQLSDIDNLFPLTENEQTVLSLFRHEYNTLLRKIRVKTYPIDDYPDVVDYIENRGRMELSQFGII